MDCLTLIKYDVRRLLLKKQNIIILIVMALISYYSFSMIDQGYVSNDWRDDPCSQMSLAQQLTFSNFILLITVILLCVTIFSEKEINVRKIMLSAPISTSKYYVIKAVSIGIIYGIAVIFQIVIYSVLYAHKFHFYEFYKFFIPALIILIPSAMLVFSIAMIIGHLSSKVLYILIPLLFYLGLRNFSNLPSVLDLCGNNLFTRADLDFVIGAHGMILRHIIPINGEYPFILPKDFIYSRWIFVGMSILLFGLVILNPVGRIRKWRRSKWS